MPTGLELIEFARKHPPQIAWTRDMLLWWMEETRVKNPDAPSVEYVDVAIMHSVMKYRLGFISKQEVLAELEESAEALNSETESSRVTGLFKRLVDLMYEIIDDVFEVVCPRP